MEFFVDETYEKNSKNFGLFLNKIWINFKHRSWVRFLENRRKILRKFGKNYKNPEKIGERLRKFLENITLNLGNWVNYN